VCDRLCQYSDKLTTTDDIAGTDPLTMTRISVKLTNFYIPRVIYAPVIWNIF